MAKVPSKGTVLQMDISSTLTAIAQITSIEHSGAESLTYDSTTLDGGVYKTYDPTGYTEPGDVSFELFFDPALSGHQAITDLLTTPAVHDFNVTFADSATTDMGEFDVAGLQFGWSAQMENGLTASVTCKITGAPGYAT